MDLEAAQNLRGKRGTLSKVIVVLCFTLTVALLASSLFSPGRAQSNLRGTYPAAQPAD
jgi:hypothetical protein